MRQLTLSCLGILCSLLSFAEEIKGVVVDAHEGNGIVAVNVVLYRVNDTIMYKGTVTEQSGAFSFSNIPSGKYRINFSFIGYKELDEVIEVKNAVTDLGPKKLMKADGGMKEVVVVSKKPLFEVKTDRMVINVKSSITSAGLTILDVLERSPGVIVNRQSSSVSLAGKSGVQIMINGKVTNMPVDAIFQMLAGMSSSNIEKIELITTPPSNLDAEGNAGYINIVMSKNMSEGTNGSLTLGLGYRDNPLYNAAANFNHRKGKFNIYGDYSHNMDPYLQTLDIYRDVSNQGVITNTTTHSDRDGNQSNHFGRLGLDYQLSDRTVIGTLISGYDTRWEMDALNNMLRTSAGKPDTTIIIQNHELNHWNNYGINFNLTHEFRKKGKISFDFDKIHYKDDNPVDYINTTYDNSNQVVGVENARSTKKTPIDMLIGKSDYAVGLGKAVDMEAGVKAGVYKFSNDVAVQRQQGSDWITDTSLSTNSKLREIIWAAYTSFNIRFSEKTTAKLGLRYEHTDSELDEVGGERVVDRNYGNFFPSASFSYKINNDNTFNLAYSRRITRPTFNQMAPWVIFFDPYSFFAGNPALQPTISDNFTMSYLLKSVVLSLVYSYDNAPIAFAQSRVDSVTGISITGSENLESMKTYSASVSLPVKVSGWWKMQNNFTGQYQEARDIIDKKDNLYITRNFQINSTQTISLKKDLSFEANFNYSSGGLWGLWKQEPFWFLNLGVQKKFEKAGTFRFNVNDVFMTNIWKFTTAFSESSWNGSWAGRFSRRSFILTWSKNFGGNGVKTKRERQTAADTEKRVE
jgi:outer membrane receptor protein involved in Fe transport